MADAAQLPLILLRNLPEYTGTLGSNIQFVGVDDNKESVRISWQNLTEQFLTSSPVPASSTSEGEDGGLATGDAVYSYYNGQWGKSPRYVENWDDLDESSRFLLVNKVMDLTEEEREILRQNVGVSKASIDTYGTVLLSDIVTLDESTGRVTVPEAGALKRGIVFIGGGTDLTNADEVAASVQYVNREIKSLRDNPASIKPAAANVLGGILTSDTVVTDSQGRATVPTASPARANAAGNVGVVSVAPTDEANVSDIHLLHVPTVKLVRQIVALAIDENGVPLASLTTAGAVLPTGALYITDITKGLVDVRTADTNTKGVVQVVASLTEENATKAGFVPTSNAIIQYLKNNPSAVAIPAAGVSTLGGVKLSDTLLLDKDKKAYVPDATASQKGVLKVTSNIAEGAREDTAASTSYVKSYLMNLPAGALNIPTANESSAGLVYIVTTYPTPTTPGVTTVPSYACMEQYVAAKRTTWNGGTVTGDTTFMGTVDIGSTGTKGTSIVNKDYVDTLVSALEARVAALE